MGTGRVWLVSAAADDRAWLGAWRMGRKMMGRRVVVERCSTQRRSEAIVYWRINFGVGYADGHATLHARQGNTATLSAARSCLPCLVLLASRIRRRMPCLGASRACASWHQWAEHELKDSTFPCQDSKLCTVGVVETTSSDLRGSGGAAAQESSTTMRTYRRNYGSLGLEYSYRRKMQWPRESIKGQGSRKLIGS